MRIKYRLTALVLCAVLSACGSSGGNKSSPVAPTQTPSPTPAPTPTPAPPPTPTLVSVTVSGGTLIIGIGQTARLTATAVMSNNTSQDVSSQAGWRTSNTAVAMVISGGTVQTVGFGEVDIFAAYQGETGSIHISVIPPPTLNIVGTWSGSGSDSSGPGTFVWRLTQTSDSIFGSVTVTDTRAGISGNGTITGRITGSTLQFTMIIPRGGFPGPAGNCIITSSGSVSISGNTMRGTYSGNNSCSGNFGNGQLTLTKQ